MPPPTGHLHVEDQEVRLSLPDRGHRCGSIRRHVHMVAGGLENVPVQQCQVRIVFGEHDV